LDKVGQNGLDMARRVRDKNIETREARSKLKVRGKPYWRGIGKGLHLGYRKGKRGGAWVIRRYIGKGDYNVETIAATDDVEDANGVEVLNFWQAQDAAGNMRPGSAPNVKGYIVAQAVADYLEHLEGRASWADAKRRLEAFVLPAFGNKAVNNLDEHEIRKWHRAIAKQGARARTKPGAPQNYRKSDGDPEAYRKRQASANRCLDLLRAALNLARRNHKRTGVKSSEAWDAVERFKGVHVPRSRYLKIAECKRVLNACDPEFRILVRAALETGARYQELARLRVADFNPDSGTLHVRKTKTHKDRHIILTDEGREFFGQLAAGRPSSAPLLGKEWKPSWQAPLIHKACTNASVDPPISFHGLRHTWASLSVMAGMPLMVVARNLGHADTRMVERHYGHLAPSYVADAVRKHAPRFGKTPSDVRAL
jgi:integrase